jgi:1,5-anhydro-D-fructose reductase (1,5-anhydro-D-mannitol-forming)
MMNAGIIGFGKMGRIRLRALEQVGGARIRKIHDLQEPEELAEGTLFCRDEKDLLQDPAIDAIFVCTPNHRIPGLCVAALKAGKHVFSEKPPGFSARDVERVIDAEKSSGRKLMYGFNHRHHESIKRIKRIVDTGEMGRVLWMRGRYGKEVDERFFDGWRAKRELAGGGILLDQGIHMLDLFLHLGGGFDDVSAFVSNLFWKIDGIEDNVFAIYRNNETGLCASLHSTMTQWRYLFSLEVFLEGGAVILNGLKTTSGRYGVESLAIKRRTTDSNAGLLCPDELHTYESNNSWASEVSHFMAAVSNGHAIEFGTSEDALRLMRLVDMTYASSPSSRAGPHSSAPGSSRAALQ